MNVGSLFSGIGGIEIGFEKAGFHTEWFIENEPYCQKVLKKRFPTTKIYGDIKEIDFKTIPKVDILTGGFPCQDISNVGKRVGIKGSRSSLWKYYLEAISTIRPKYALIENVSAICSRGLSTVLCDLASIGYDAEWYSISASAVGAYHQRKRIFIIAYPKTPRWIREEQLENDCKGKSWGSTIDTNKKNKVFEWEGKWSIESRLGRVAHRIPNRMDRLKSIGNSVVPQLAEVLARAIKEGEN